MAFRLFNSITFHAFQFLEIFPGISFHYFLLPIWTKIHHHNFTTILGNMSNVPTSLTLNLITLALLRYIKNILVWYGLFNYIDGIVCLCIKSYDGVLSNIYILIFIFGCISEQYDLFSHIGNILLSSFYSIRQISCLHRFTNHHFIVHHQNIEEFSLLTSSLYLYFLFSLCCYLPLRYFYLLVILSLPLRFSKVGFSGSFMTLFFSHLFLLSYN